MSYQRASSGSHARRLPYNAEAPDLAAQEAFHCIRNLGVKFLPAVELSSALEQVGRGVKGDANIIGSLTFDVLLKL